MRLKIIMFGAAIAALAGTALLQHRRATAAHEQSERARVSVVMNDTQLAQADAPKNQIGGPADSDESRPKAGQAVYGTRGGGQGSTGFGISTAPASGGGVAPPTQTMNPAAGYPQPILLPTPYGVFRNDFTAWGPSSDPETNELTRQDQQLEAEAQSLERQLADAENEKQRADLKEKLTSTLEKQFDTQQKLRELEVSRIEARVRKLRGMIQRRGDSRRKIIDNRLEQLLNDAEGLGWSSSSGGPQYPPSDPNMFPPGMPYGPQNQGMQLPRKIQTVPQAVPPAANPPASGRLPARESPAGGPPGADVDMPNNGP